TQASVGSETSLMNKLRCLAAIQFKWIHDIGYARQEMIGEQRLSLRIIDLHLHHFW
ncbi:hypothetical protein Taro_019292, partial [Colocasia esculenta]|nr:hypothetical protein [Colocasia esculenta]